MNDEIITISGQRYRVVYVTQGPYVRADGKGEIPAVRFARVVPL